MPVFFSKGNSKFIIAKIDSDNIKLNDIAIDKNDYIIGRVIDVFDNGMFKKFMHQLNVQCPQGITEAKRLQTKPGYNLNEEWHS